MTAPYYQDDAVTLYLGDCMDVMRGMDDNSVDMVLTDAPYNAGFIYGDATDDARPWPDYAGWLDARVIEMERVATGPVFVYVSVRGLLEMSKLHQPSWVGAWPRPAAGNPAGDNRGLLFLPQWEPCMVYGDLRPFKWATSDVWSVRALSERNGHPCPKPLSLMRLMLTKAAPVQSVLDPFAGSGTTLRAAADVGKRAIGIEIDKRYCEIAARRLRQGVLDFEEPA